MNTKSRTIHLHKINQETLSPGQYIKMNTTQKANITYTEVIPPRLGQKDFGRIRVHYKNPVYR